MSFQGYEIVETSLGPTISRSRTTVYDVMLANDAGHDMYRICVNYNLTPLQVMVALEYIKQHREKLELELKDILKKKAEREEYYRTIAAERKKIPVVMTPQRAAFYALRQKHLVGEKTNGTSYSKR